MRSKTTLLFLCCLGAIDKVLQTVATAGRFREKVINDMSSLRDKDKDCQLHSVFVWVHIAVA